MSLGQKQNRLLFSSLIPKVSTSYIISTVMSHQNHHQPPSYATDPNTMFVQADPSSFRNIVQKLTGAPPPELSTPTVSAAQQKLPLTPKKPAFKLHERRQSSKKMELKINNNDSLSHFHRGFLVSPVSHLDPFWARVSPHSTHAQSDNEEQKAIAEKGFYFLPSPRSGGEPAPELLPLFPLRSPNGTNHRSEDDYRDC